jgi:hypothetical protein
MVVGNSVYQGIYMVVYSRIIKYILTVHSLLFGRLKFLTNHIIACFL